MFDAMSRFEVVFAVNSNGCIFEDLLSLSTNLSIFETASSYATDGSFVI